MSNSNKEKIIMEMLEELQFADENGKQIPSISYLSLPKAEHNFYDEPLGWQPPNERQNKQESSVFHDVSEESDESEELDVSDESDVPEELGHLKVEVNKYEETKQNTNEGFSHEDSRHSLSDSLGAYKPCMDIDDFSDSSSEEPNHYGTQSTKVESTSHDNKNENKQWAQRGEYRIKMPNRNSPYYKYSAQASLERLKAIENRLAQRPTQSGPDMLGDVVDKYVKELREDGKGGYAENFENQVKSLYRIRWYENFIDTQLNEKENIEVKGAKNITDGENRTIGRLTKLIEVYLVNIRGELGNLREITKENKPKKYARTQSLWRE